MSDLLDKHSDDFDPDAFTALVDDQLKREKENALDAVIPPARELVNYVTGEIVDRDDAAAVGAALAVVERFIDAEVYGKHRQLFRSRDELRARQGELRPTDLPARRYQSKRQEQISRCPRCRTRLPQTFIEEPDE